MVAVVLVTGAQVSVALTAEVLAVVAALEALKVAVVDSAGHKYEKKTRKCAAKAKLLFNFARSCTFFVIMKVIVSEEIAEVCPEFVGACLEADVVNSTYSEPLWKEIHELEEQLRKELTTESVKELPSIAATRAIYKKCGKDPSRYRPASE